MIVRFGVLDMLADKSNWGTPMQAGRGRGIAIMECYGTVTGQVAEVTVDPRGAVKVDRHDYQVVRMFEAPKIETYLHLTGGPR